MGRKKKETAIQIIDVSSIQLEPVPLDPAHMKLLKEHGRLVEEWFRTTVLAASNFPERITPEQAALYRKAIKLQDESKSCYDKLVLKKDQPQPAHWMISWKT
jgi:hypothetical protein